MILASFYCNALAMGMDEDRRRSGPDPPLSSEMLRYAVTR